MLQPNAGMAPALQQFDLKINSDNKLRGFRIKLKIKSRHFQTVKTKKWWVNPSFTIVLIWGPFLKQFYSKASIKCVTKFKEISFIRKGTRCFNPNTQKPGRLLFSEHTELGSSDTARYKPAPPPPQLDSSAPKNTTLRQSLFSQALCWRKPKIKTFPVQRTAMDQTPKYAAKIQALPQGAWDTLSNTRPFITAQ